MGKILGLDLGTNSIGWAVVDNDEQKILDSGVRIFPEGVDPATIGQGENEMSKNALRREHRQSRRQFFRKKLRKIKLLEALIQFEMCPLEVADLKKWKNWDKRKGTEGKEFPQTEAFVSWLKLNPYELRAKAVNEQITRMELGRILYHMIQRRGFLSSRKGADDGKIFTGKENMTGIDETREKVKDSTLGAYLYDILPKEGENYSVKINDERVRARYTLREMYIKEFELIWQKQAKPLGLNTLIVETSKTRYADGNIENSRNQHKLNFLIEKYGENNVEIDGEKIITFFKIPLKEYLAGEIYWENEEVKFKSNESVLFYQRPLRSQKGLLGNCRFEDEMPVIKADGEFKYKSIENRDGKKEKVIVRRSKKPCALSHPEFELFRAYQFINNIKYGKTNLDANQRKIVLDLMNSKDGKFNFELIPKALKLTYEKFNYEDDFKVAGNPTIKKLSGLFTEETWMKNYDEIWHCFYFYDDNEKLLQKLKRDFDVKTDSLEKIKNIKLIDGYGSVSLKAIRNILPFLEKGYQYDRAVVLGGVKNAFGERWENFKEFHGEIEKEVVAILNEKNVEGEAMDKIKKYLAHPEIKLGFNKQDNHFEHLYHHSQEVSKHDLQKLLPEVENLRNPIVQQGINELRRLVNQLIKNYTLAYGPDFKFDKIKVEMGRELKNSKERRREMTFKIRENEQKNDEARERLAEHGLKPTRINIQKYLMFNEISQKAGTVQCPYTGKTVSVANLLGSNNEIQIEHIIPYSVSLDDSFINKTICEANFNREKGEKTPYQFYLKNQSPELWGIRKYDNPDDGWKEIETRAFKLLPYAKAKRFTSKQDFKAETFIERQLNDTRYISKKAVELLSHVCDDVRVLPGQLTAELRHLWGLNNVLQPVEKVNDLQVDFEEEVKVDCYLLTDENNQALSVHLKRNKRPETNKNEILLGGNVNKGSFKSRYLKVTFDAENFDDGKYWAKIKISEPVQWQKIYAEKPIVDEKYIVFRGRVDKNKFVNDAVNKKVTANTEDGFYWGTFNVLSSTFEKPQKGKQPKAKGNKVLLYGSVYQGVFSSYIYKCTTDMPEGNYWAILEIDLENATFKPSVNPRPKVQDDQLLITGTVDDEQQFAAEPDKGYTIRTNKEPGKYFTVFNILSDNPEFAKIENEPPKAGKGEKIIEGNIWADKYTGEIRFDPKKNRDDNRHHAIDAMAVAFTEQGYLQNLSTLNAQRKNKERGVGDTEKFPQPWPGFDKDVKDAANSILVSYKKSNKILSKISKKIVKNGKVHQSIGYAARGQLHKESVFGKRKAPKQQVAYHIRKPITDLKNNKHIDKVVDEKIRELIKNHLHDNFNVDTTKKSYSVPNNAFFKDGQPQLFLPNKKGGDKVPIKKVRIKASVGNAQGLKGDLNQWVNPRNNHHVLIYKDFDNQLKEQVVTFWEVAERQLKGYDIYALPKDGKEIVSTLEMNDMYLLGLSDEEFETNYNDQHFLSSHLYRVQKVSGGDYNFRFHLASNLERADQLIRIRSLKSWLEVKTN